MALIACPECNREISETAAACPGCGAKPPRAKKGQMPRAAIWALLAAPVLFVVWANTRTISPEDQEKITARDVIDLCWKDQAGKSVSPDTARLIARQCEKFEHDFLKKFCHAP